MFHRSPQTVFADIILIASSLILAQMDEDIKAEPLDDERLAMFTSYNILPDNISANEAGKHEHGLIDSFLHLWGLRVKAKI